MQTIAVTELKEGMILAEDVISHRDELLAQAGTAIQDALKQKFQNYNIICVNIKDAEDLADTHFQKVQASMPFHSFSATYNQSMRQYKASMQSLLKDHISISSDFLYTLYLDTMKQTKSGWQLLDFLYNKMPSQDDLTYAHCFNSALISGVFANWLHLSTEETRTLIECAFYYDIGKLLLPDSIIWKSGKLTELEYTQMKMHTIKGFQFLEAQGLPDDVLKATLSHHERCDGSGYPSRLKSLQINKYAKLISIIDAYEAMTAARTYRTPLLPFKVIEILEKDGYEKYDISYLLPILQNIAATQVGRRLRLSNGTEATVMLINKDNLSKPILKTTDDQLINMSIEKDLEMETILS